MAPWMARSKIGRSGLTSCAVPFFSRTGSASGAIEIAQAEAFVWRLPIYQPPTRQPLLSPDRAKNLKNARERPAPPDEQRDAARVTEPVPHGDGLLA